MNRANHFFLALVLKHIKLATIPNHSHNHQLSRKEPRKKVKNEIVSPSPNIVTKPFLNLQTNENFQGRCN